MLSLKDNELKSPMKSFTTINLQMVQCSWLRICLFESKDSIKSNPYKRALYKAVTLNITVTETTSQNYQLPVYSTIFIAVTLYVTVSLPFPKAGLSVVLSTESGFPLTLIYLVPDCKCVMVKV